MAKLMVAQARLPFESASLGGVHAGTSGESYLQLCNPSVHSFVASSMLYNDKEEGTDTNRVWRLRLGHRTLFSVCQEVGSVRRQERFGAQWSQHVPAKAESDNHTMTESCWFGNPPVVSRAILWLWPCYQLTFLADLVFKPTASATPFSTCLAAAGQV